MTDAEDYGCDGCARVGVPLLEANDGKSLCLVCIEADPDLAGVKPQAVEMLQLLTRLAKNSLPAD
jgi:hypothetical protein